MDQLSRRTLVLAAYLVVLTPAAGAPFGELASGSSQDVDQDVDELILHPAEDLISFRVGHVLVHLPEWNTSGAQLVVAWTMRDLEVAPPWANGIINHMNVHCPTQIDRAFNIYMRTWDDWVVSEYLESERQWVDRPWYTERDTVYAILPPACSKQAVYQLRGEGGGNVPIDAIPDWPAHYMTDEWLHLPPAGDQWYDGEGRPIPAPGQEDTARTEEDVEPPPATGSEENLERQSPPRKMLLLKLVPRPLLQPSSER